MNDEMEERDYNRQLAIEESRLIHGEAVCMRDQDLFLKIEDWWHRLSNNYLQSA